jgi:DNA-directed RNA polymerase sigma subunit (sigma70/sigma32)
MQDQLEELMESRYGLTVKELRKLINKVSRKKDLTLLTEEEKMILTLKFDLDNNGVKYTLAEIGQKLNGKSTSYVSQKMHGAFGKLYGYKF